MRVIHKFSVRLTGDIVSDQMHAGTDEQLLIGYEFHARHVGGI